MNVELIVTITRLILQSLIGIGSLIMAIIFFKSKGEKNRILKGTLLLMIFIFMVASFVMYFKQY